MQVGVLLLASCLMPTTAWCQDRQRNQGESVDERKSNSEETESKSGEEKAVEPKPKQVKIGGIQWYVNYDAAQKIAKEKNKPMWLHFGENPG